ncbi:hypothetical protein [Gordonia sp. IITR100]|uniref:hypothetical protein n=1 Tax=Gordonia sp. IITR100 TaxID=1314686 RepID=UPI000990CAEC|nr:hypothetical protein [Gordonia sp. IITR100]
MPHELGMILMASAGHGVAGALLSQVALWTDSETVGALAVIALGVGFMIAAGASFLVRGEPTSPPWAPSMLGARLQVIGMIGAGLGAVMLAMSGGLPMITWFGIPLGGVVLFTCAFILSFYATTDDPVGHGGERA